MSSKESKPSEFERISLEAAEWVVKQDKGLSAKEQDSYFQWLADDPRQGEALADLRQSWSDFNLLAQWCPEHSEEPNPDLLASIKPLRNRSRYGYWGFLGGIAAMIALGLFIWVGQGDESRPSIAPYSLQFTSANYGYHVLEDGSEIDMNEHTEVLVSYSASQRQVKLVSGEAHFTVAKNPDRPFIVEAGGTKVCAVGTAFNVRLSNNSVEVLVTEGRVRMEENYLDASLGDVPEKANQLSQDLLSGQRSIISFKGHRPQVEVRTIESDEIDRLLEWKPDVLDFSSTPLSAAILEFNKRNQVQLVIADSELADLPIVASFRSNNIDGFVRLLKLTMNVEADEQNDFNIVLRKPGTHNR